MEFIKSLANSIGALSLKNLTSTTFKVLVVLFAISIFSNSVIWFNDEFLLFVSFSLIYYFGCNGINSSKLKISVAGITEMIKESLESYKASFFANRDRFAKENSRVLLRFRNRSILFNTLNLVVFAKRMIENLYSLLLFKEVSLLSQKKVIFEYYLNSLVTSEDQYLDGILHRIIGRPISSKSKKK